MGNEQPSTSTSHARLSLWRAPSLRTIILLLIAIIAVMTVDAAIRERGELDYRILRLVHEQDIPGLSWAFRHASRLTDTRYAIGFWGALFLLMVVLRRWLEAAIVFAIPIAGVINETIRRQVGRTRPDPELLHFDGYDLTRAIGLNDYNSFPSGHVAGGILLWGFIFFIAGQLPWRMLRWPIRVFALAIIVLVGPGRMWLGAHWASDVIAGYCVGGLWLALLIAAYQAMAPTTANKPLIHSAPVSHPECLPHAHALTSTLLFRDDRVYKIYNPGFVPRFIYWLAFQAPFGYAHNPLATEAAVHRRNLAAKLTEAWYGRPRVSPAHGYTTVNGQLAIVGHYTEGEEPCDHSAGRAFLFEIAAKFDEVGLPTWQIDPRQPRSLGNILETPTGEYVIIDLESGLVSPMASPRAWMRAIRRGLVPMYDDVFFDLTRAYVEREEPRLRSERGDAWFEELAELLANAEGMTAAWHASEPRLWSRAITFIESGFGLPGLPARLRKKGEAGRGRADAWIESAIDRWHHEGRLSGDEASQLRQGLLAPGTQAVLPHFGVHLAIGIALRFPFGAITRVIYTTLNLLLAFVRFLLRRRTWARFRLDLSIHSPIVILLAALPGFGTFSYLAAGPLWRNHLLGRVVLDAVAEKVPFHLYQRMGIKRIVARPIRGTATARGMQ